MKTKKITVIAIAFAAMLLLNVPCSQAQNPAPANGTAAATPAHGSGDRGEQFRQKMNEYMKATLKVSDEEWSVIQPLLEQVQTKQREAFSSRSSFFGKSRGGGDRSSHSDRPASPETDALKAALETDSATPVEIKSRLEAVRAARKKALAELEQAREDLRKVLTQRQEATLVMVGILE